MQFTNSEERKNRAAERIQRGIPGQDVKETAAERWDKQMAAWLECQMRTGRRPLSPWESASAARRYWEQVQRHQRERIEFLISRLQPVAGKRILDIGCGPGVLTIPLAEAGARVTGVEPSPAMLEFLRQLAEQKNLAEISFLPGRWEDHNPINLLNEKGPYHAVIASLSLLMVGIRDCLVKMRQVCTADGSVFLLWPQVPNHWTEELSELYPRLYGFPYVQKPGADLLLEVLLELQKEQANGNKNMRDENQTPDCQISNSRTFVCRTPEKQGDIFRASLKEAPPFQQEGPQAKNQEKDKSNNPNESNATILEITIPKIEAEPALFTYRESFTSPAEALDHFQTYFGVDEADDRRMTILREFLARNLKSHNGYLQLEHPLPTLLLRF